MHRPNNCYYRKTHHFIEDYNAYSDQELQQYINNPIFFPAAYVFLISDVQFINFKIL